ncbi:hypothetical protein Poli38472_002452 [Pythium oligandrum]|uniref:t-SNARE coiled-coil homology domain-containing protein n=1 Tax=Pythium oligandrum TaxID=41045 RepID=A0A8K1FI73_PYTOL|nr:hypothetical protein Poli38472_002452 [Pythium oligandrum]|eukprot:TMW63511.1 hypothetical protein Poli38472_002452 [Pythium oligandrum]
MSRPFPPRKPSDYSKINNEADDSPGEDDYVRNQRSLQQAERQKQDESLDQLHVAVKRIGDMSLTISSELETQNSMLDDLNEDTDKANDALQAVTKKTQELIKQSGGMKNFIVIIVLSSVVRKLIPFGNRVLVKRFEPVAKTASGIYLPDADQQKQNEGEVVAVGQGLRNAKGELVPVQAAVGDKVLLPEYGGSLIKLAGEDFHLYRDDDLLGKLE